MPTQTAFLPPVVKIKFRLIFDQDNKRKMLVQVVNDSNVVVYNSSMPLVSAWLHKHGYHWKYGSNGLWERG